MKNPRKGEEVVYLNNASLGETIAFLRSRGGMTRRELAKCLEVSEMTVSNYESGKTRPNIETLSKVAAVFGVSLNVLLTGYENDKSVILDN